MYREEYQCTAKQNCLGELQSSHKLMHCITHLHCMLVSYRTYFDTVSQTEQ
jgi:hypothetical protein